MRRYTLLALAVTLFFAIGMMAQASGTPSGSSDQYPSSSDQSGMQSGSSQSDQTQSGSQSDQSGNPGTEQGNPTNRQPGMGSASQTPNGSYGGAPATGAQSSETTSGSNTGTSAYKGKGKTIEGCVFRRETDYYIVPTHGQPQRISNEGQSVGEHVGHHVKLRGSEAPSAQASASESNAGGTAGETGNTNTETGSGAGTTGSMSGNTAGMGASARGEKQEFVVDRVQMLSETCPANIQKNAQAEGMTANPQ